jgi:uncharacterized membrane-anchored protein
MKKIFKRIQNIVLNKRRELKENRNYKKQAKRTLELKKKKLTDYKRWQETKELYLDWNQRTEILASMITQGANIIEFGAGSMALKNYLKPECNYTPSDIQARTSEMLVCDLNDSIPFDLKKFDTAVFSGVFEYVYDVDKVFRQLSESIKYVVLSYACSDISNADRLKSGWLSDYSKNEMEAIFKKYDYQMVEYSEWRNQSIFSLRKFPAL